MQNYMGSAAPLPPMQYGTLVPAAEHMMQEADLYHVTAAVSNTIQEADPTKQARAQMVEHSAAGVKIGCFSPSVSSVTSRLEGH